MTTRVGLFSALMVSALVVSGTPLSAAQTSTSRPTENPGTDSSPITECPAVHMLLAPGTSETSRFAEPNQDTHGFLSRDLARPVMGSVNGGSIGDLSSGFAAMLDLPPGMQTLAGVAGSAIDSAAQGPTRAAPRLSRTYVTYPATVGGAQPPGMQTIPENFGETTPYIDSMRTGVKMTEDLMGTIARECPDTKIFLSGFSQGAEVVSNVARRVGAGQSVLDPDQIAGVALFADPTRSGGTPLQPDGASSVGPVPGTDGTNVQQALTRLDAFATANAGGLSTDKTGFADFGQISDRVVSWCLPGDYVCGLPVESELVVDIVKELERVSLGDPVAALDRLAHILDRAVSIGDLSEIANIDFGGVGFSTRPDGGAKTPVLTERVHAAQMEKETTTRSSHQATTAGSTGTETAPDSEASVSEVAPTPAETVTSLVQGPPAGEVPPPAPMPPVLGIRGLPGIPPLPTPEQVVKTVVDVAVGIGGMALGAGITVARKTITPANLAQIAVAGVTGGPHAAGAVAVAKLSQSAMTLLEPGSATGYARQTLQIVKDAGVPIPEQVELAVSLSSWLSTNEHNAYGERPVLPDGRSASQATNDWVEAIAADVTAGGSDPVIQEALDAPTGRSALEPVAFDTDAAHAALTDLDGRTETSTSTASTTTSPTATTTDTRGN